MKIIRVFTVILFLNSLAYAEQWACDVQEKPQTQIFFDSTNEILWLMRSDLKIDLISNQRISSWQMAKEKCEIKTSFDQGDQFNMYSVIYHCGYKIGGSFQFDFKALEGYYLEDLYQGGNRNLYSFSNCRPGNIRKP